MEKKKHSNLVFQICLIVASEENPLLPLAVPDYL